LAKSAGSYALLDRSDHTRTERFQALAAEKLLRLSAPKKKEKNNTSNHNANDNQSRQKRVPLFYRFLPLNLLWGGLFLLGRVFAWSSDSPLRFRLPLSQGPLFQSPLLILPLSLFK
jgi:hypothetical protein